MTKSLRGVLKEVGGRRAWRSRRLVKSFYSP